MFKHMVACTIASTWPTSEFVLKKAQFWKFDTVKTCVASTTISCLVKVLDALKVQLPWIRQKYDFLKKFKFCKIHKLFWSKFNFFLLSVRKPIIKIKIVGKICFLSLLSVKIPPKKQCCLLRSLPMKVNHCDFTSEWITHKLLPYFLYNSWIMNKIRR